MEGKRRKDSKKTGEDGQILAGRGPQGKGKGQWGEQARTGYEQDPGTRKPQIARQQDTHIGQD